MGLDPSIINRIVNTAKNVSIKLKSGKDSGATQN